MSEKLNPKQQRFADEYLIDLNATAAYKRAGYSGKGNSAESMASQLLSNIKVKKYIASKQLKLQEKLDITQERVLAEYAKLAFLDPRKFYDENGSLIPIHKLPADVAAALAATETSIARSGEDLDGNPIYEDIRKIKFSDKRAALDSIARTLGMFNDKMEHSGSVNVSVVDYSSLHKK